MSAETIPQVNQDPAAQAPVMPALGPVSPNQAAVVPAPTEYIGRHRAVEQEPQNPDRWLTRSAERVAELASKFAESTADRRTPKQFAQETTAAVGEKLSFGRKLAAKFGRRVVNEVKRTGRDIADNAREDFAPIGQDIKRGVEAVRSKWTERATAAKGRKAARLEARREQRAIRNEEKALKAENAAVKQQVIAEREAARKEELRQRAEATRTQNAMLNEAYAENKRFDNAKRAEARAAEKALSREERARRVAAAKVAGKTMLKGAGLAFVAPAVVVGMGAGKVAKETANLGRDVAASVSDRTAEAKDNWHDKRASKLEEKADAKAAKLRGKAAKHVSKIRS